jgi:hypothetical protein
MNRDGRRCNHARWMPGVDRVLGRGETTANRRSGVQFCTAAR